MKLTTIRSRMLLAALLPVTLVVVTIVLVFWVKRLGDLDDSYKARASMLLRQVSAASEYGLFSGNIVSLQSIVGGVQKESDVRSVSVFDVTGALLARSGDAGFSRFEETTNDAYVQRQRGKGIDTLVAHIRPTSVPLDDFFGGTSKGKSPEPYVLGHVVIEMSRESLGDRERELLWLAVWVGAAGLALGGLLAGRLGEGVVQPVMRVSNMIERIGQGDFTPSSEAGAEDPLHELQARLNEMATRLAWGREETEYRISMATKELRIKKEEAETATLAKSRFLAAASHDLRQPTHALGMFVTRLGQLPLDAQARHIVVNLESAVAAMQDLLDGLLDISRLDAGAIRAQIRPVALDDVLQGLNASLAELAHAKGLRLKIRHTALWGMTDPQLLQRVLLNIANNAIRYTDTGTVLISCRSVHAGQHVRVDVSDSGVGIAPENQTEIFREFYQVGNSHRDRTQGLGLGLNIVERTANLLGHPITLRSNLGCGSRFSLTLGMAKPNTDAIGMLPADVIGLPGLDGFRIMVVEDDGISQEAVRELLLSWGCIVDAAFSQEEALALLASQPYPDIILSDYRLGNGTNGLSVIATLRATAGREIPACLMSGDTDTNLMQAARDAGLTLLHKPVRPAKLRSLLRRLSVITNLDDGIGGL